MASPRDFARASKRVRETTGTVFCPNPMMVVTKVPDSTPYLITRHATSETQLLLAKVRYNRLIDIFLRVTAYSLQNHLRSAVPDLGQIETDEVYVAVRNTGQQFVVPVQAKGGTDPIGAIQVRQDLALCRRKFPNLTPRPVAVQFTRDAVGEVIAMFELAEADGDIGLVEERHYRLVPASQIGVDDLARMAGAAGRIAVSSRDRIIVAGLAGPVGPDSSRLQESGPTGPTRRPPR